MGNRSNNRYRIRGELACSLSAVLTAALGTRMSRHSAPDVVFVCFVSCDRLVLVHTRSVSFYVALSLLLRRCCFCYSLSRSCLWADYGCLRKCVDTSRYLSMCLCDFRLQLLSLSGGVVLLLLLWLLRPLLAALLLCAAKSFSTCTRLTDAVIICAFCAFVRLSGGFGCGSAASLLASLFAFCTRVIM